MQKFSNSIKAALLLLFACSAQAQQISPAPALQVGNNLSDVPAASTARTNLGIVGGSCTNQAATAVASTGAPTCTTLTSSYVDTSIAKTGTDINTSNQVTATHLAAALPAAQGGTGSTTVPSAGQLAVGNAGGTAYVPITLSQDCTVTSAGVTTCLKTNNVAFGSAATQNTGTSGATLPFLNGNNTWGGTNAFGANALTGSNAQFTGGFFTGTAANLPASGTTAVGIGLNGALPYRWLVHSGAGADAKIWDEYADASGIFHARTVNDAQSVANDWLTLTRTGATPLLLTIAPALTVTGAATFSSTINKVTVTAPATSATLTIANGKTLTASNTLTFTGTDSSSVAFGAGGTVLYQAVVTVTKQVFTASGTYTPTTGMIYAAIQCVGSGGGGGGAAGSATGASGAGGGGAGSYSYTIKTAAQVGASQTVTIGAAGSAGAAGNNAGGVGGDTSVGALCIGKGGSGGAGSAAGGRGTGGAGGVAGTGDYVPAGNAGLDGQGGTIATITAMGGVGGAGHDGGAPMTSSTNAAGCTAGNAGGANTGAGGGGASCLATASTAAGAAGGTGVVVITEFNKQ